MCRVSIETPSLWDEQESSTYADYENHVPLGRTEFSYIFSRLQPVPLGRATAPCIRSASKPRPSRTSQILLHFLPATGRPSRTSDSPMCRVSIETPSLWDEQESSTYADYENHVPLGRARFCYIFSSMIHVMGAHDTYGAQWTYMTHITHMIIRHLRRTCICIHMAYDAHDG